MAGVMRPVLFLYAAVFWAVVAGLRARVRGATLALQFGDEYERYRQAVPAWAPRRTPWRG
jgi:protein-S-isoprenylcysteine O-methyltransferase Ste14